MSDSTAPVRWFSDLGIADIPAVGGKNASLGELTSQLAGTGVLVPNGFALTAGVYRDALAAADAGPRLHALLDRLDISDVTALARAGDEARTIVYAATGTAAIKSLITEAYAKLEAEYGPGAAVAVRSSATAEDLPTASFAGQHESYLNMSGPPTFSRPAAGASRPCSPTAPSSIASITGSTISRSRCRSA